MTTCETCAAPFNSARSHKRHLEESPESCIEHFQRTITRPPYMDDLQPANGLLAEETSSFFDSAQCALDGDQLPDVDHQVSHCQSSIGEAICDDSESIIDDVDICDVVADDTQADSTEANQDSLNTTMESKSVRDLNLQWPSINFEIVSRLCNSLSLCDRDCDLLMAECMKLDLSLRFPRNVRDLRAAEAVAFSDASFHVSTVPVPVPRTRSGHAMVEEATLSLIHRDLLLAVQDLVNIQEHAKWMVWHCDVQVDPSDPDGRIYSELNTGHWWEDQQQQLPDPQSNILACILSCDETPMTMTGRKVCPVYATCGNLPLWHRQKSSGLTLVGFIPIVRAVKAFKDSVAVRSYRRLVKRWCMGMLLKPIMDHANGIGMQFMNPDGSLVWKWVYPRFPFLVGDEPEVMHSIVGGYGSTASRMPCSHCDIVPKVHGLRACGNPRDINVIKDRMCLETQTSTITSDMSRHLSIHPEFSFMPFIPGLNPHMNPADRMHQYDHGVFILIKDLIVDYIKANYCRGSLEVFDLRWSRLARVPGMKLFKRGVSSLAFVPCFENRIMAMGLPFVLRGLCDRRLETADPRMPRRGLEDLAITYLATRWLVGQESLSSSHLQTLAALCDSLQQKTDALHLFVYGEPVTCGIKFHKLVHWVHYIQAFGNTGNWNTEVFETAHKDVKRWKHCMSYQRGHSAGVKIMHQMNVSHGHIDAHSPSISKPKGSGPGGFRGRVSLEKVRGLTTSQVIQLQELEGQSNFEQLAVEHLHDAYMGILPPHCEDIAMLSTILNTNTICMDCRPTPQTDNGLCFFSPRSCGFVQCWHKTYCKRASIYVSCDRDVRYVMFEHRSQDYTRHIGRVRWIVSIPNAGQFVVIQRMQETTPLDGVDLPSRLAVCVEAGPPKDPIKRHCFTLRLRPSNLVASYHILTLTDDEDADEIEDIVMLQPDFGEAKHAIEHQSYFLLDYIIQ